MAANTRHLKRHSMPTAWPIQRKTIPFVSRPKPGSHKREYVVSALIIFRDVLNVAKNTKEAKFIINNQQVLLNGKQITNVKQPIGLFDVIEIPATKQKYSVLFDTNGKIHLSTAKQDIALLKIVGKKQVKGGKLQLNFMNGYNLFVDENTFNKVSLQDTIAYDFKKKSITSTIPLAPKSFVYIYDGKFQGQFGQVNEFTNYSGLTKDAVEIEINGVAQKTIKEYCYAIGTKAEDLKRFD